MLETPTQFGKGLEDLLTCVLDGMVMAGILLDAQGTWDRAAGTREWNHGSIYLFCHD